MNSLEHEIQAIQDAFIQNQISEEERNYLLTEIRDVRAATECANDEQTFRLVVQACNIAMGVV